MRSMNGQMGQKMAHQDKEKEGYDDCGPSLEWKLRLKGFKKQREPLADGWFGWGCEEGDVIFRLRGRGGRGHDDSWQR